MKCIRKLKVDFVDQIENAFSVDYRKIIEMFQFYISRHKSRITFKSKAFSRNQIKITMYTKIVTDP